MSDESKKRVSWPLAALVVVAAAAIVFVIVLPRGCIEAGTEVATPDGPRAIERLRVGDRLWCRAPDGARVVGTVVATRRQRVFRRLELQLEGGGRLGLTADHPVATPAGWRRAGALREGDRVQTRSGPRGVRRIHTRWGAKVVYDLSVLPHPNFYAAGVVVHNKRSPLSVNEGTAIAFLRSAVASQEVFREAKIIDQDKDGKGEYGFLAELAGQASPRGGPATVAEAHLVLDPKLANGVIEQNGYCILLYLGGVREPKKLPKADAKLADAQEKRYVIYAWPAKFGKTGRRVFAVDQRGEVFQAPNGEGRYSGSQTIPAADACPFGKSGGDGQKWEPVGG